MLLTWMISTLRPAKYNYCIQTDEPVHEAIEAIAAQKFDLSNRWGFKIHDFGCINPIMRTWPDSKIIRVIRNKKDHFESKAAQYFRDYHDHLSEDEFNFMIERENQEIHPHDHLLIHYEHIPNSMEKVFTYLNLTPGKPTPLEMKSIFCSRTASGREVSFDETGWAITTDK